MRGFAGVERNACPQAKAREPHPRHGQDDAAWFTQAQARDLIAPHLQCIARNCPLCVFWEPISRSIRLFFGEKE